MSWSITIPVAPARLARDTIDAQLTEYVVDKPFSGREMEQINHTGMVWADLALNTFGEETLVGGTLSGHAGDVESTGDQIKLWIYASASVPRDDLPEDAVVEEKGAEIEPPIPMTPVDESEPAPAPEPYAEPLPATD